MTIPGIKAIDGCSSGWRPASGIPRKPLRDDAQSKPRIDSNPFNACKANIFR